MIFIVLAAAALVYGWAQIVPFIVSMLADTLHMVLLAAILGAVLFVIFSSRTHLLFRLLMRAITGMIINIDPIGILKDHLSQMRKRRDVMSQHPQDAVVLSLSSTRPNTSNLYRFEARLRNPATTDTTGNVAMAAWSNGTVLAIVPKNTHDNVTARGSSVFVTGSLAESAGRFLLIPASSQAEALAKIKALQNQDLEATAKTYWEAWMNSGILPSSRMTLPSPRLISKRTNAIFTASRRLT